MWFKSKPKPPEPALPVTTGERFKYLGVDMLCTGEDIIYPGCGSMTCISAEYVDLLGRIQHIHFLPKDFDILKEEIRRGNGEV